MFALACTEGRLRPASLTYQEDLFYHRGNDTRLRSPSDRRCPESQRVVPCDVLSRSGATMTQSDTTGFRTSPDQRQRWSIAERNGLVQWVQLEADVAGPIDGDRLAEAVSAVAARHEILRTRVNTLAEGGGPVQVIDSAPATTILVPELAGRPQDVSALLVAERDRLADEPGIRIALARLGGEAAVLILTARATLADRRSLRRLLRELVEEYAGQPAGSMTVQYADYAAWHNDLLDAEDRGDRRAYWDGHVDPALADGTEEVLVPAGRRPGERRVTRTGLDADLSAAATEIGVDVTYATAWAVLLWRLCGERDVVISGTVSGRSLPQLDAAIGPFARDVPVISRFSADMSFRAAEKLVRKAVRDAAEYADDLDPVRLPRTFWTDVPAFEFVDAPGPVTADSLIVTPRREYGRTAAALVLRACRNAEGHWLELEHDVERITPERADALLARLCVLLKAMVEAPDAPLGAAGMLLPGEQDRLARAAIGPSAAARDGGTLHGLVREQAKRTPDAPAIDDGHSRLSYAELDRQSDKFSGNLVAAGVGPGARVVLFMERSTEFVVSLLAVLKAGAGYVPVDVRQPAQRLMLLLAGTASPVLVTGPDTVVPCDVAVPVVRFRSAEAEREAVGELPDATNPDDVAYVMYTSGSTGVPNGVVVSHRALLNYLWWAVDAYDLRSGSGTRVHSSIGFDLTVTGLLGPLLVGQRVVLVPESDDVGGLVSALRLTAAPTATGDVTLLKLTPSHLVALAQLIEPAELMARVRTLVLGGEQLRAEVVAPFRATGMRIVNEYGPTETVVGSCAYWVDEQLPANGPVPIGRPISGTSLYLLDAAMKPVPDGVVGEIFIGGAGVADGYLGRPELTGQRFVDDPFEPGGPLYRTGDRAVRRPSGDLVYLGRADDQLKVRGYRVEPGEIEAVMRSHPRIADAAVVLVSDGEHRMGTAGSAEAAGNLAATVVAAEGSATPSAAELAAFCRERLPEYLVPIVFVSMSAIPTTPNGKLDRDAVARVVAGASACVPYAASRTETEEILTGVIAAVIGRERVGIDDNYFVIGGDSIRSVMVASRAQARGVSITVADLHRHPTVRELGATLEAGESAVPEVHTQPFALVSAEDRALMPAEVEDAFPLNLLQEGMIFHRDFAAKSAVYHAIASVRLKAPLDLELIRRVIRELVERHPMLRTSFDQITFSTPLQLVHSEFRDPLSYEDLTGMTPVEQDARVESWVESEKQRGFELDEHPLIRFMVQKLDEESFQFTYGFHHEIVDGWSEALMVTEIFGHYFSTVFDEPMTPQPPTSSMRDAVALELQALERKENYEFWARYLEDATLMRLPRWNSAPQADKGARDIVRIPAAVSVELSDALKRLAGDMAVPLKSVLLAAHMAVMNLYHGQHDTLTYTVTNGRPESADGSTAIGLFVNSLALRVNLSGGSWRDLIAATLDSERQSLPYRRLPMAELKRHQGNEPLAETLFFFTDYHVFRELERWRAKGVEHVASELYGESTFPFCAIFRLNRETGVLEIRLEYDGLQFPSELMDDVAAAYTRVLETIVADPGTRYDQRPLLSVEEYRRLVVEWNDTGPALQTVERAHDLVRRWAGETPDAIAVADGRAALTYAALDRMSSVVAADLVAQGVGRERTVALLAECSVEAIVCLLGILKSGAVYLPIDPGFPDARIAVILADATPVVVLAEAEHAERVARLVDAMPVEPNGNRRPPAIRTIDPSLRRLHGRGIAGTAEAAPDNAAYVIYTSGSTGAPKGVVITHRALVNSTMARASVYEEAPQRYLLLSSLVFDSSIVGLFWPLATGGTLVVPSVGIQLEPAAVVRYIEQQAVTHTLAVSSLLTTLLDQDEPERLRSLQVIIGAGEASSRELFEDHAAALPGSRYYNEYGPTENTVWSTVWSGQPVPYRPQLPIGRPIGGVDAYVLSAHGHPVPIGVPGELCLGGVGLARGYLGRPALTAASFLPNPFADEPGARLYRTGDLARYTPDGELEFLSRKDSQVKIRGFRVELGEIEGVLDSHPDVHRSVVVARDHSDGESALVSYVAAKLGTSPTPADLQRYVRDRLPKYMVPSSCVVLGSLPLSATGKVDRVALPAPEDTRSVEVELVQPRTETERLLTDIWRQALGRVELGIYDEFFDIGGESLRAMQVVTRTNKVFGLDLSVRSLFDAPTVAAFAETVAGARVASWA